MRNHASLRSTCAGPRSLQNIRGITISISLAETCIIINLGAPRTHDLSVDSRISNMSKRGLVTMYVLPHITHTLPSSPYIFLYLTLNLPRYEKKKRHHHAVLARLGGRTGKQ